MFYCRCGCCEGPGSKHCIGLAHSFGLWTVDSIQSTSGWHHILRWAYWEGDIASFIRLLEGKSWNCHPQLNYSIVIEGAIHEFAAFHQKMCAIGLKLSSFPSSDFSQGFQKKTPLHFEGKIFVSPDSCFPNWCRADDLNVANAQTLVCTMCIRKFVSFWYFVQTEKWWPLPFVLAFFLYVFTYFYGHY